MKFFPEPGRGHRKFTVSLLALVLSFILAVFGMVGGTEWVTVVGLILGLYGGANVAEHFADRPHNPNPTRETVVLPPDEKSVTTTTRETGKKTETRSV